jgi:hypothetical protein
LEFLPHELPDFHLVGVHLLVCQGTVHVSIVDAEALACAACRRMLEGINDLHGLCQVPGSLTHDLEELVLVEASVGEPESNVLVAGGEFGVRLELSDLASLELAEEASVITPEQSNVLDVKHLHGPSLKTKTEGPADLIAYVLSRIGHDTVMNDSRAEHLEPLVVVENLQFGRGLCEGEIGLDPAHLNISENVPGQIFKNLLEVSLGNDLGFFDVLGTDLFDSIGAHTLHLMESGVVGTVYSVLPVHIAYAEERGVALSHQRDLMDRGMWTQAHVSRLVVGVRGPSARVIFRDAKEIKALLDLDQRVEIFEEAELLIR